MVEKLVPDPFIKIKFEHISGLTVWNILKFAFIVRLSRNLPKHIKTEMFTTFVPHIKLFLWLIFCMIFNEHISHVIFYWLTKFYCLIVFLMIMGNMCIVIICCAVCWVINFEINFSFLIKLFFYINKTSRWKCKYLNNEKSF